MSRTAGYDILQNVGTIFAPPIRSAPVKFPV